MPRHGDTRSPSPVGSSYSSKRSHRDDDRYQRSKRDDGRSHRYKTRSRSPEVRAAPPEFFDSLTQRHSQQRKYRDRDSHHHQHDRSRDRRRDYDGDRSGRRERSREHRRSRERDYIRSERRRSRDRDSRNHTDDSRDRARRKQDDSTDAKGRLKRADSRERSSAVQSNERDKGKEVSPETLGSANSLVNGAYFQKSAAAVQTDEQKKVERLAKLEAWKRKQAAERDRKQQEADTAGGTRGLLAEIDKKAQQAISNESPDSPITPVQENGTASPAPYAGKFDPKAIAKKVSGSSAAAEKLGDDIALPSIAKVPATTKSTNGDKQFGDKRPSVNASPGEYVIPIFEEETKVLTTYATTGMNAPLKVRGNVSGFGLASKVMSDADKSAPKLGVDFGDEEAGRKKLEKLPTPPLEDASHNDNTDMNDAGQDEDEDEDDEGLQEAGTEEEAAAAARAAAEKREERLHTQTLEEQAQQPESNSTEMIVDTDVAMIDAPSEVPAAEGDEVANEDEDEDEDPLDAYMSGLGDQKPINKALKTTKQQAKKSQQPEALFGDDEVGLDAVGDGDDFLAVKTKSKKKEIPAVNHAKVNYEAFRKDFYHEPAELSEMTIEDVTDLRLELDGIKIRGIDAPKPVQKWSQLGLGVASLDVIQDKLGFEKPSSIQSQAIPAIMSGRDVIGVAKTGSGKTIAFLLPMFRHIKDQRPLESLDGPIGLIMTPTRELATQIHKECKPFLKALNLRAVCAYGGAPIKDQIAECKRGCEIIVCTPGRAIELLSSNQGRVLNLRRVTYLVLDEADRMFDMGFEPQVMKILGNIRPDRQTVLFSATFPRSMEVLAKKSLQRPLEIIVGGRSKVAPEVTQVVEVRPDETKFVRLLELLGELYYVQKNEDDRVLVFVDRQESADSLLKDLLARGYPCMSIHGGKDQIDRDSAIQDFKAGVVPILTATSVAARGLDVKQLKLVVNYDAPNHLEDYVHRAGRTGRAGNTGTAVTFLTPEQDRFSIGIAKALKDSGQEIPEDVQKLVDSFTEKVKSGKEKASASGFGGKGLERLDQDRDAARARERKSHKMGDEPDDDEKEDKAKDDKNEDIITKAASAVQPASAAPPPSLPGVPKGIDLDGKITVHKTEVASTDSSKNPLDKVGKAVAMIHEKLQKNRELRQGVPIDNKGPDAGAFHATLEINDFPQKARWAVTNRTNVAKILEATGTSITTKGSYYAAGKEPQAGENPKLYILVEGDTEVVVTNAMRELMRLLKEGTIAAADSDARAPASGRYNVV